MELQLKYPNVYKALTNGDANVTKEEIITDMHNAGLNEAHLPFMEKVIAANPMWRLYTRPQLLKEFYNAFA